MKMKRLGEKGRYLPWLVFAGTLFVLIFFLARYTVYTLNSDASSELVLAKHLAVMDLTATSLAMENDIPVVVFALADPQNIVRAVMGEAVGTVVTK